MITNERQYRITKAEAERFEKMLNTPQSVTHGTPDRITQARRQAAEAQLAELRAQLAEYERLRQAHGAILELESLDRIPEALIAARVASGLTQEQLAGRLGVSKQQVQRDEQGAYAHATLERLSTVAQALGVTIRLQATLPWIESAGHGAGPRHAHQPKPAANRTKTASDSPPTR